MTTSDHGNFGLWRRTMGCLVVTSMLMASNLALATVRPGGSGVTGTVTVSPGCPGPVRPGKDCVAPLADAPVQLLNREGKSVAQTRTAADGSFRLQAPAGRYKLHMPIESLYPRCEPVPVQIRSGRWTEVKFGCDSGMR